ncbi:MAG: glycosyltransferase family 4 protein [Candidatus Gracilibacteria bacterium]|nr:glycosyltransferase family 4 protein [Candidatus Gracilibacteria bacterium]
MFLFMIPKNKRIAVLHPRVFEVGGAVNMMIYLSYILQNKGNNVALYTTKLNKDNFIGKINFPIEEISFRPKFISYLIIAYKIRNYEIIFAGNSPMHFVGVLSKLLFRSKAKLFWWNHHYPWYHTKKHSSFLLKVKRLLEKFSVKYIDVLIANSLYIKSSLEDIFGENNQIKLLYPRCRDEFYNLTPSKDTKKTKINIFTYSRWVEGKNIKIVFEAFSKLSKKYDFNLIIGGEGKQLDVFKTKYSNNKNIMFLGSLDDKKIIKNLRDADIFLFPSLVDSFGMVVLEAMLAGLPIVGFDFGGVSELVKNGKNGFLVKSDKDFISKLETLLKDEDLRKEFSKNSYHIAVSNFGSGVFEEQLSKVFS